MSDVKKYRTLLFNISLLHSRKDISINNDNRKSKEIAIGALIRQLTLSVNLHNLIGQNSLTNILNNLKNKPNDEEIQ